MRLFILLLVLLPVFGYSQKAVIDSTLAAAEKMISIKELNSSGIVNIKPKKGNKKRFIIYGHSDNSQNFVIKTKIGKSGTRVDKVNYQFAANKIRLVKINNEIYKFTWKKYSSENTGNTKDNLYLSQKIIFLKGYLMVFEKYDASKRTTGFDKYFYQ